MFRRKKDRLEPVFGTGRGGFDLRLSEDDRSVTRSGGKGRASRRDEDDDDYDDPPPPRRRGKQPDPPKKKRRSFGLISFLIRWTIVLGLWAVIILGGVVAYYASRLPPTHSLEIPPRPPNIAILFSDGSELASRGEMAAAAVKLKSLAEIRAAGLCRIEDRRFYQHFGLDFTGLARAPPTNITRAVSRRAARRSPSSSPKTVPVARTHHGPQDSGGHAGAVAGEQLLQGRHSRNSTSTASISAPGPMGSRRRQNAFFGKPATALSLSGGGDHCRARQGALQAQPDAQPRRGGKRAQTVLFAMAEQGFISDKEAKAALAAPAEANRNLNSAATNYVATG